ncbi:isocitrate lyase/PEP mutase family protein [Caldovatus aquaticus]|uniref:Isocitrate lyase/PEP mutase family protein n=1 Tax=Caldovatus aquaticus TaxID=2865671 RepID=A0ABS7F0F5_9PROT|nr:isocitrate lyase/PEP mutase family protein [Caldovatus aquaticus]MBW8268988.1 isocitrate lyase/PEP mutase family protein [Caldovatus aquaticus]
MTTAATRRRARLRALLAGTECLHPASVYDPLSARIAEDIGFELGMFAGSTASLAVLGAPDLILVTLTEFAEQCRRIGRAAPDLPVLVDADHGYGNALNAMRTVQEVEAAGIAAATIEDTLLPRPYGAAKPQLVPREEGLGKIRAALAARDDPAFLVVARTGAAQIAGLEEAIARARAYEAAGADALFFTGVRTRAQLAAIAEATRLPLILGSVEGELADRALLAAHRVRIALQGHQPIAAAAQAVHATLRALRDGVKPSDLPGLPPPGFLARLMREERYAAWTRDFLGGG